MQARFNLGCGHLALKHYDEALAVPGLLQEIEEGERAGMDAYVIACFGDPGLSAARELARGPVIGIAEAAMHMASLVAPSFSVVTTLARTSGMAWHLAERYGITRKGDRVKLDCGGARCGDSSDCSSDSEYEEEEYESRRHAVYVS